MQKRLHFDWLLYGTIALLGSSILGWLYVLWQTYKMTAR